MFWTVFLFEYMYNLLACIPSTQSLSNTILSDVAGNPVSPTEDGTVVVTNTYDRINRLDAAGESWKTHYDAQSRPVTQTRPSGHSEATEYDKLGNRTAFINAETNAIRYGVDAQGRVTAITNAIGNTTRFGYDDSGNVAWRQNADSNLVNYTYDTLNRLTSVSYKGDCQKNFTYDANGNCLTASGLIGTNIYAYDVMNRLTSSTIRVHSHSFAVQNKYDANGNRTNLIYPGGLSVGYAYDAENRLIGVTANHAHNAKHFTFAYDGASRLTGLSYPNRVHSTFGYNAEGQVTNFTYDGFIRRQNTRNALGFKSTETINAGLAPQSPPARQLQKTHNAANQLTGEQIVTGSVTSQLVYAYDDNGCLKEISKNPGPNPDVTYTYDYENRLSSVQSATFAVHYQYDTEGARIARTCNGVTTYFIPDPVDGLKRPLAEADAQGHITRYYVWSGARLLCHIEADGRPRYYHSDELGSTLALTDEYGVTDQFAYMPYGYATHSGSTQTPFLWLGGYGVFYDDAADLHLTVHRAYSSRLKRFIQPDPLGIDGGPNVYMWANMNPLFFVDPLGLCAEDFDAQGDLKPSITDYEPGFVNDLDRAAFAEQLRIDRENDPLGGMTPGYCSPVPITEDPVMAGALVAARAASPAMTSFKTVAPKAVPDGKYYSVAYEMKLNPKSYPGKSSYMYFKEANLSLEGTMRSNSGLSNLGISVPKSSAGSVIGKSPAGWVWHHDVGAGTMQLVPKVQHPNIPGGIFWETLHPGGKGGMSIWGGGH